MKRAGQVDETVPGKRTLMNSLVVSPRKSRLLKAFRAFLKKKNRKDARAMEETNIPELTELFSPGRIVIMTDAMISMHAQNEAMVARHREEFSSASEEERTAIARRMEQERRALARQYQRESRKAARPARPALRPARVDIHMPRTRQRAHRAQAARPAASVGTSPPGGDDSGEPEPPSRRPNHVEITLKNENPATAGGGNA